MFSDSLAHDVGRVEVVGLPSAYSLSEEKNQGVVNVKKNPTVFVQRKVTCEH